MPTLEFKGKQHIYAHHLTVPHRPLIVDPAKSFPQQQNRGGGGGTPVLSSGLPDDNLIIHGDNLHALKALLPRYAGKVNCIYIDPPYNTGKEGWIYNDNVDNKLMRDWFALNKPVDGEDLERHDKWLCMMQPRLELLRELLADDGVIFASIDDNEQHHLRLLMDDVFGSESFLITITVISNLAGSSDQFGFAGAHEYCLAYAKDRAQVRLGRFPLDEDALSSWSHDEIGYYKLELLQRGSLAFSESLHYPIFVNDEGAIAVTEDDKKPLAGGPYQAVYPLIRGERAIWRWSKTRILASPEDVVARRRDDGSAAIYSKQRPSLGELPSVKPKSVFYKPTYSSRAGGRDLTQIIPQPKDDFPYPKAVALIKDLLLVGAPAKDAIILDSFAGSGTTGQATMALNADDGGARRFILIECEGYANTLTAERVRRVIKGTSAAKDTQLRDGLGGSFTYCTLGEPLDLETMLRGDSLPSYAELATYLLYTASGISVDGTELEPRDGGRFFGDESTDYYLFYEPDLEWLQSNDAMFTEDRAKQIRADEPGRSAVVFAAGKFIGQRELSRMNITFCQLPYELHRVGG